MKNNNNAKFIAIKTQKLLCLAPSPILTKQLHFAGIDNRYGINITLKDQL